MTGSQPGRRQNGPYANVKVLTRFLREHADEPFTTADLLQATGVRPGSLRSSLRVIDDSYPGRLQHLGRGQWLWRCGRRPGATPPLPGLAPAEMPPPPPPPPPFPAPENLAVGDLLEVIWTENGEFLVRSAGGLKAEGRLLR